MKKNIFLVATLLCTLLTYARSDALDTYLYEQQEAYELELELAGLSGRYPSVINNLYDTAKEGFRDVHLGLWKLCDFLGKTLLPDHTHTNSHAFVRRASNNELCYEEKQYMHVRTPHVRDAQEAYLDMELTNDDALHIGMCFSGGGFRAMVLTLGFLKAAQETGLFDASMFMCGLSGSTWAIAPWIASGVSMEVYMNQVSKKIAHGVDFINNPDEMKLLMHQLMIKTMYKQPISAMDLYGSLLANTLLQDFGESRMNVTISQSHQDVIMGFLPLPIYTSIQTNKTPYEWMECTPYEVGSDVLKAYIPTWAYGRKFQHGASLDTAPEQSLGYFMGIFGSAFEVNFQDIVYHTQDQMQTALLKLPYALQSTAKSLVWIIQHSPLNNLRLFPSMLRNYTHNVQWSPLCDDKHICLVDAGIDFNLPLPPLLRPDRKLDVIIVYDASGIVKGSTELKRAQLYAQRKGLKFPKIDYARVDTSVVSVFQDEDASIPVVIYFPRIANADYSDFDPDYCTENGYCATTNFTYSAAQFKELSGLSEFTLKQHTKLIQDILKQVITKKRNQKVTNKAHAQVCLQA